MKHIKTLLLSLSISFFTTTGYATFDDINIFELEQKFLVIEGKKKEEPFDGTMFKLHLKLQDINQEKSDKELDNRIRCIQWVNACALPAHLFEGSNFFYDRGNCKKFYECSQFFAEKYIGYEINIYKAYKPISYPQPMIMNKEHSLKTEDLYSLLENELNKGGYGYGDHSDKVTNYRRTYTVPTMCNGNPLGYYERENHTNKAMNYNKRTYTVPPMHKINPLNPYVKCALRFLRKAI